MKRFVPLLFRWGYLLLVLSCTGYLIGQIAQRSDWYQRVLYDRMVHGSGPEQVESAMRLAALGAQGRLLEALRVESATVREAARKALDYIWFNSAGEEAFAMVQKAVRALKQDEPGQALETLTQLTEQYPRFAEGWNRRASVYWELGDYEQSMADCERALRLNPNLFGAWQGIGICQLELGDISGACESLRRALEIIPFDESTRRSLRHCEELLRVYPRPTELSPRELLI